MIDLSIDSTSIRPKTEVMVPGEELISSTVINILIISNGEVDTEAAPRDLHTELLKESGSMIGTLPIFQTKERETGPGIIIP